MFLLLEKLNLQPEEAAIIIYILASHCVWVCVCLCHDNVRGEKVKENRSSEKLGHGRFVNYLE